MYARGAVRKKKRIVWREDADLVQVEYFELDETERVNVNKLKFEERRKMESEFEKSSLQQKSQVAAEESRPWPAPLIFDCQSPDVVYGSSSVEKVTQAQRENSVLQALYFNNKLPNDPSEPENATTIRFDTKDIPLIDDSGEETFMDYSDLGWPLPAPDNYARVPGTISPQTDAIFANIHQNLNNMMGATGGVNMDVGSNRIETAMLAQMAAEESMRGTAGLHDQRFSGPGGQHPPPPHPMDQAYEPGDEPYDPMDAEYGMGFPPTGGAILGGPPPPFPPNFNGPRPPVGLPPAQHWNQNMQHNNFRGNSNRGFFRGHRGDGSFRGKERRGSDRKDGDFNGGRRPCKFFTDKGFCRDGERCKFLHQRR